MEITNLLKQFLDTLANEIKGGIPSVSHETANSVQVDVSEKVKGLGVRIKGELTADKHIYTLEDGRKPTKSSRAGSPTLQQTILKWIEARGITPKLRPGQKKPITQESLSWAMAIKIHNEGSKLYRAGGKSGVLSAPLNDKRIETFIDVFSQKTTRYMLDNLVKQINQ